MTVVVLEGEVVVTTTGVLVVLEMEFSSPNRRIFLVLLGIILHFLVRVKQSTDFSSSQTPSSRLKLWPSSQSFTSELALVSHSR